MGKQWSSKGGGMSGRAARNMARDSWPTQSGGGVGGRHRGNPAKGKGGVSKPTRGRRASGNNADAQPKTGWLGLPVLGSGGGGRGGSGGKVEKGWLGLPKYGSGKK